METQSILATIKDIVLITGSLTSTLFAIFTYNKWKKEHKGKIKYELCRNVLKTVFKIRDDYRSARSPMMFAHEMIPGYSPGVSKESENLLHVHNGRIKYLAESCSSLHTLLPEIEIELNSEIKNYCNLLLIEIHHYQMKISEYIQVVDNEKKFEKEYIKEIRSQIYDIGENAVTKSFNDKVDKIKSEITKEIKKAL